MFKWLWRKLFPRASMKERYRLLLSKNHLLVTEMEVLRSDLKDLNLKIDSTRKDVMWVREEIVGMGITVRSLSDLIEWQMRGTMNGEQGDHLVSDRLDVISHWRGVYNKSSGTCPSGKGRVK